MILNSSIEEIKNKTDIIQIISAYVPLKKRGKNHIGLCPFHAEKTPSFTVSPDKGIWHCFGCNEGGNVFAFLMKIDNTSFSEAVESLGDKLGIEVKKKLDGTAASEKDRYIEIMNLALKFYRQQLTDGGQIAWDYIKNRDISKETADALLLGYAPDRWEALYEFLIKKGISQKDMLTVGLILERKDKTGYYDRFRNRLMFPIFNITGKAIGFSGRTLGQEEEAKYINSPDSPIYNKGYSLYGLNLTKDYIKKEGFAILVEGNIDLLTCYQFGIRNVIAPLGTAFTDQQAKMIKRFTNSIIMVFDKDSAGSAATIRGAHILRAHSIDVFVAGISEGKDPDEALRKNGVKIFIEDLKKAKPWTEYNLGVTLDKFNLNSIEEKAKAIKEVAKILAEEKDSIVLKEYMKLVSERTNLDHNTIETEVKRQTYYISKPYFRSSDSRQITQKPSSKLITAEETLIKMVVDDPSLIDAFKNLIHWGQFTGTSHRTIAEIIQTIDVAPGTNFSNSIMDNLPSDETKKIFRKVLVSELPSGDKKQMLEDCINTIKAYHVKSELDDLRNKINNADKLKDYEQVTELQKRFNECNQLYRVLEKVL